MQVAIDAGERKIVGTVGPAMNLRDDVLDMERGQRRIILVQMTILAAIPGTLTDLGSRSRPDHRPTGLAEAQSFPLKNGDELIRADET